MKQMQPPLRMRRVGRRARGPRGGAPRWRRSKMAAIQDGCTVGLPAHSLSEKTLVKPTQIGVSYSHSQ